MNLEYRSLLPQDFPDNSRVWVYQSNRLLALSEALDTETELNEFTAAWSSHGAAVKAYGNVFFGQFLVLMVDENIAAVSGCSTDASVRFVKDLGSRMNIDFFNRTNLAFFIRDKIQTLPFNQISYAVQNGFLSGDTLFFNNLVSNKKALEENWIIPLKHSWLASKIPTMTSAG